TGPSPRPQPAPRQAQTSAPARKNVAELKTSLTIGKSLYPRGRRRSSAGRPSLESVRRVGGGRRRSSRVRSATLWESRNRIERETGGGAAARWPPTRNAASKGYDEPR